MRAWNVRDSDRLLEITVGKHGEAKKKEKENQNGENRAGQRTVSRVEHGRSVQRLEKYKKIRQASRS